MSGMFLGLQVIRILDILPFSLLIENLSCRHYYVKFLSFLLLQGGEADVAVKEITTSPGPSRTDCSDT